jgi:hypothetical protein
MIDAVYTPIDKWGLASIVAALGADDGHVWRAQREILRHERCSGHDQAPDEPKKSGDENHKCGANHWNKDEPDDGAEWLMTSLTPNISRPDEVFGRDRWVI